MRTYVLYIPGLGDRYDGFRRTILRGWSLWGVTARLVPVTWYDGGNLEAKLARIESAMSAVPDDARIVLIGESAGASLALHMASRNMRIDRVITLCGVAQPSTPVSSYLRRRAPALDQAVKSLPIRFNIEIHSVRAAIDGVVGAKYSSTDSAIRHVIWSVGHLTTIALCLSLYSPIMSSIAKSKK